MPQRAYSPKCSNCRQRTMAISAVPYSVTVSHDGREYPVEIPSLAVPKCSNCGNIALDDEANKQIDTAFRRQAHLLTPEEIKRGIDGLRMSQQAFAERIGVSPSTLSRWVTGVQVQQRCLNKIMLALFASHAVRQVYEALENVETMPSQAARAAIWIAPQTPADSLETTNTTSRPASISELGAPRGRYISIGEAPAARGR